MNSRVYFSILSTLALAGTIASCGSEGSDASSDTSVAIGTEEPVTIRVSSVNDGLAFAFRDISPEFKDVPYEIELVELSSSEGLAAVSTGAVDIAHLAQPIAAISAQGNAEAPWTEETAPFKVIAAWSNPDHPGVALIAKDPSIRTPADLDGKKVGFSSASLSHFYWLKLREEFGLKDVEEVTGPSAEIRSAFLSGALDAAIVLYRNARTYEDRGQGTIIDSSGRVTDYYLVTIANPAALNDARKAEAIADFLERTERSMEYVRANPQVLIDYFLEKGWIEEGEAQELVSFEPRPRVPLDDETQTYFNEIIKAFFDEGLITSLIDPEVVMDRRFDTGVARK